MNGSGGDDLSHCCREREKKGIGDFRRERERVLKRMGVMSILEVGDVDGC